MHLQSQRSALLPAVIARVRQHAKYSVEKQPGRVEAEKQASSLR
jgi:hypothetical protein